MSDTTNEPTSRGITASAERLAAIIREMDEGRPNGDNWAAVRERAAANLSPAELAAARAAVRKELRNRG